MAVLKTQAAHQNRDLGSRPSLPLMSRVPPDCLLHR